MFHDQMQEVSLRTVTLTPPQLKALAANPVEIVPAPGAGRVIVPLIAFFRFNPKTTPYAGPGQAGGMHLEIAPGLAVDTPFDPSTFMNTARAVAFVDTMIQVGIFPYDDLPLVLAMFGADLAGGDGSLTVSVLYSILSTTDTE